MVLSIPPLAVESFFGHGHFIMVQILEANARRCREHAARQPTSPQLQGSPQLQKQRSSEDALLLWLGNLHFEDLLFSMPSAEDQSVTTPIEHPSAFFVDNLQCILRDVE